VPCAAPLGSSQAWCHLLLSRWRVCVIRLTRRTLDFFFWGGGVRAFGHFKPSGKPFWVSKILLDRTLKMEHFYVDTAIHSNFLEDDRIPIKTSIRSSPENLDQMGLSTLKKGAFSNIFRTLKKVFRRVWSGQISFQGRYLQSKSFHWKIYSFGLGMFRF